MVRLAAIVAIALTLAGCDPRHLGEKMPSRMRRRLPTILEAATGGEASNRVSTGPTGGWPR